MDSGSRGERQPLLDSVTESTEIHQSLERQEYRDYKRRWFILATLALLNLSNGLIWISFSPIADFTAKYFHISSMQVNWLAIIYMVLNIPLGFVAMWFLDTIGLRAGIIVASWLNCVGAVLRIVACLLPSVWRYPVLMIGQGLTGCAQPLILFSPTKLAALWFKDDQRALANMVGSMANPIGVLLGNLLSPAIVTQAKHLPLLMQIYTGPAALGALMATFGVCSSVPPTPPTSSAAEMSEPFVQGLKKVIKNKSFLVLMVSYGGGFALVTTLITLLEQILCVRGYSDSFSGLCGALMFGIGIVGAGIAAVIVDKTKKFEETAKIGLALSSVLLMLFLVVARYPHNEVALAIILSLVGFFGFSITPVCLELGVECTYPVAEATSTGFIMVCGQLQALILTIMMPALAGVVSPSDFPGQTCVVEGETGVEPQDYTISNMVFSGISTLLCVIFIIFFKCDYKRLKAEEQMIAERILNYGSRAPMVISA